MAIVVTRTLRLNVTFIRTLAVLLNTDTKFISGYRLTSKGAETVPPGGGGGVNISAKFGVSLSL
jgi:hypothetical protein